MGTNPDAEGTTSSSPSAPDSLETTERASRDKLTTSVGRRLEANPDKPSLWKRLRGKS